MWCKSIFHHFVNCHFDVIRNRVHVLQMNCCWQYLTSFWCYTQSCACSSDELLLTISHFILTASGLTRIHHYVSPLTDEYILAAIHPICLWVCYFYLIFIAIFLHAYLIANIKTLVVMCRCENMSVNWCIFI